MRFFVVVLLLTMTALKGQSQDLAVDVKINYPALNAADPSTLQQLETAIREFYNNTEWTDDDFYTEERIEASIQINVKRDPSPNTFIADIFISSARPVFMSNYSSQLLNHVDNDVAFQYDLQPIIDNTTNFTDNLSSILTFYAYIILGYDYDSFSPYGGEKYFRLAQDIINNVPANVSAGDRDWTANGGDRTRYWIIENLFNARARGLRQSIYDYHRNGLDKMHSDISVSKAVILSSLKGVGQVEDKYRNSMIVQMFANAKRQEILEIFKNSVKSEQRTVYNVMASIDPSQVDQLKELR